MKINTPFIILIIIAAGFTAYSFMLDAPFKSMDDQYSIVQNEQVKDVSKVGEIFKTSFFGSSSYYRPLVSFTFLIEHHLFGDNPFFYNLTNVLIHLANSIIVFFLLRRLTISQGLSFLAALLFTIHPVHWEAVSNIPGRSILLCAFFVLSTFLLFLKAEEQVDKRLYIGSLVSFVFALLSKESACMFPFVIVAYKLFVTPAKQWRFAQWQFMLPYFGMVAVYVLFRKMMGITKVFYWPTWETNALGVLTFARSIFTYLRLFIFPYDLHFDRAQVVFTSFADPLLWLTILGFVLIILLLVKYRGHITKLMAFLIIWFFIELFPVSQIVASIGVQPGVISIAEHFLYIPAVSMFALLVLIGERVYKWLVVGKERLMPFIRGGLLLIYVFFFLITVVQSRISTDDIAMLKQSVHFSPHNGRIRSSLALTLAKRGYFKEAEGHFRKVVEIDPLNVRARIGLGKALCDQGRCWEGIQEYEKIQDPQNFADLLNENLRLTYNLMVNKYKERIVQEPDNPEAHYSLGVMYSKTGEVGEAIEHYEKAVDLNPDYRNALFNLGVSYAGLKNWGKAVVYYERMLTLEEEGDHNKQAVSHLSEIYKELDQPQKAEMYLKKAQELDD